LELKRIIILIIIFIPKITPTITQPFIVGFGSYGRRAERASGSCTSTRQRHCAERINMLVLSGCLLISSKELPSFDYIVQNELTSGPCPRQSGCLHISPKESLPFVDIAQNESTSGSCQGELPRSQPASHNNTNNSNNNRSATQVAWTHAVSMLSTPSLGGKRKPQLSHWMFGFAGQSKS
jgi:hypothetical protein